MASLNKVILIGHLTADPELKRTQNGVSVCSFSIGVNRRFARDEQAQTDFINIVAWRNTAEFIARYFRKGSAICICGSIQTRSWTDQNGYKRYATEVVADEASFVESKKNTEGTAPAPVPTFEEIGADEDLPF